MQLQANFPIKPEEIAEFAPLIQKYYDDADDSIVNRHMRMGGENRYSVSAMALSSRFWTTTRRIPPLPPVGRDRWATITTRCDRFSARATADRTVGEGETMENPFLRRATEFLRDEEAFLAIVSPEPVTYFVGRPGKNGILYDRLVLLRGTPGSGKTTLARLFEPFGCCAPSSAISFRWPQRPPCGLVCMPGHSG